MLRLVSRRFILRKSLFFFSFLFYLFVWLLVTATGRFSARVFDFPDGTPPDAFFVRAPAGEVRFAAGSHRETERMNFERGVLLPTNFETDLLFGQRNTPIFFPSSGNLLHFIVS